MEKWKYRPDVILVHAMKNLIQRFIGSINFFAPWRLGLVLVFVAVAIGPGNLPALGPAPYPKDKVSFEIYQPEPGVVLPGETFRYEFSWNGIVAAEARWEIKEDPDQEGRICSEAVGEIVGSVALVYRGKDSVRSCMDAKTFKPETYSVKVREPFDYYDLTVRFNHEKNIADRRKKRKALKSKNKSFDFTNGYCPVSLALLIRSLPWSPGVERSFEVVDGNDRNLLVLRAEAYEEITVAAGTFRAVRIQPSSFVMPRLRERETPAYWEKQKRKDKERASLIKNFTLWIGADPPRPFIKIRSDVYFGHIDMELVEMSLPGDTR